MDPVFAPEPSRRGGGLPCPHCRTDLIMTERLGIEIDYCAQCRGVWLDRGELDKIIDRSLAEMSTTRAPERQQDSYRADDRHGSGCGDDHGGYRSRGHGHGHGNGHDRRGHGGSFLRRLFD